MLNEPQKVESLFEVKSPHLESFYLCCYIGQGPEVGMNELKILRLLWRRHNTHDA